VAVLTVLLASSRSDAQTPVSPPPAASMVPVAQPAAPEPPPKAADPFAFADFTWLNGNSRQTEFPMDTKVFTGELSVDVVYVDSFAQPQDHSIVGSANSYRSNELQLTDLSFGGDFHWKNVRARFITQFGLYSTGIPRNDASVARGQWDLADAYRYLAEASAGYHWDMLNGINLDAGMFLSYIGLCSYYNFENWIYQPSYLSANTPWYFVGIRLQIFPSDRLKIEPWLVNGWESYGVFNEMPGMGFSVLWRPVGYFSFVSNNYFGADVLASPQTLRFHTDNSVQLKYFEKAGEVLTRGAFSLTIDAGCQTGGGFVCGGGPEASYIAGVMFYNRLWFFDGQFALTLGGGAISNPSRYLALLPPVDGATAATGTPFFTEKPGQPFNTWDTSVTFTYMPNQFLTLLLEFIHRASSVPYFAGPNGVTPPGGNNGSPQTCGLPGPSNSCGSWIPDLVTFENRMQLAVLVRL
jgi:hypothetical protein